MTSRHKRHDNRGLDTEAERLLRDPFFLYKAIQKVGSLGVVGEERNRGILILTCMGKALPA